MKNIPSPKSTEANEPAKAEENIKDESATINNQTDKNTEYTDSNGRTWGFDPKDLSEVTTLLSELYLQREDTNLILSNNVRKNALEIDTDSERKDMERILTPDKFPLPPQLFDNFCKNNEIAKFAKTCTEAKKIKCTDDDKIKATWLDEHTKNTYPVFVNTYRKLISGDNDSDNDNENSSCNPSYYWWLQVAAGKEVSEEEFIDAPVRCIMKNFPERCKFGSMETETENNYNSPKFTLVQLDRTLPRKKWFDKPVDRKVKLNELYYRSAESLIRRYVNNLNPELEYKVSIKIANKDYSEYQDTQFKCKDIQDIVSKFGIDRDKCQPEDGNIALQVSKGFKMTGMSSKKSQNGDNVSTENPKSIKAAPAGAEKPQN